MPQENGGHPILAKTIVFAAKTPKRQENLKGKSERFKGKRTV